jgi:RNA polymerase sigma-70 factor (ECF subfamily)
MTDLVIAPFLGCTVAAQIVNDPGSIESLYIAHHSWLQGWLRRRLGNSFDASDLAHDTFVRVLARRQIPALQEPRSYLSTIARGLVVDHWRRRELEQAWLATLSILPESEVPSPEQRLVFLEALVEIDRLLDTLKPAVRTAFLMAQLDAMTCPQIARHLGVSLATVERYIAKALRACYAMRFET